MCTLCIYDGTTRRDAKHRGGEPERVIGAMHMHVEYTHLYTMHMAGEVRVTIARTSIKIDHA